LKDYDREQQEKAKAFLDELSKEDVQKLQNTIMAGLPGTRDVLSLDQFRAHLARYKNIDKKSLKENLTKFLRAVVAEAEKLNVKLCVHPDDPPYPILGLPRVVSTLEDIEFLLESSPSYYNGLTFCTGSLGGRADNDLLKVFKAFSDKIHFLHLRSVALQNDNSFYEANHLEGSAPMPKIMEAIVKEQLRRKSSGNNDIAIPFSPDHGHLLLADIPLKDEFYPGYSTLGRMKGLAELNGLEKGIRNSLL